MRGYHLIPRMSTCRQITLGKYPSPDDMPDSETITVIGGKSWPDDFTVF
ncbi:hypothetical protein [Bradyrhizobium sp.]